MFKDTDSKTGNSKQQKQMKDSISMDRSGNILLDDQSEDIS